VPAGQILVPASVDPTQENAVAALQILKVSFMLCSTDTDTRIGIGRIRIRGYVKFLQKLKAQRCIGVSDTDTRIRIGYVIWGHVEVSGLYSFHESTPSSSLFSPEPMVFVVLT